MQFGQTACQINSIFSISFVHIHLYISHSIKRNFFIPNECNNNTTLTYNQAHTQTHTKHKHTLTYTVSYEFILVLRK